MAIGTCGIAETSRVPRITRPSTFASSGGIVRDLGAANTSTVSVTPAQVKAVIAIELDPKHEIVITLGDRPTVEKARRSDVTIVEPD